jgi:uncharacterized coiled-coil protein SlyX
MSNSSTDEDRLQNLELSLMHLQKDYDQLNEVVIDLANRHEQLQKSFVKLTAQLEHAQQAETPRDAESEKPPHY